MTHNLLQSIGTESYIPGIEARQAEIPSMRKRALHPEHAGKPDVLSVNAALYLPRLRVAGTEGAGIGGAALLAAGARTDGEREAVTGGTGWSDVRGEGVAEAPCGAVPSPPCAGVGIFRGAGAAWDCAGTLCVTILPDDAGDEARTWVRENSGTRLRAAGSGEGPHNGPSPRGR